MPMVNTHEAKTHLSRLLDQVQNGEEVIIARSGKPVARLVAIQSVVGHRQLGKDEGLVEISDDFDAPLPDEILKGFIA